LTKHIGNQEIKVYLRYTFAKLNDNHQSATDDDNGFTTTVCRQSLMKTQRAAAPRK